MVADKKLSKAGILAQKTVAKYIISLREDGILHCHVSVDRKWVPEDFRLLFQAIGEMVEFKKVPLLVTYDKFVFPAAEASAYWGNPETACKYISSEAQVLNSLPLKVLGNFYLTFKKPSWPTKVFENTQEAIAWLKTQA